MYPSYEERSLRQNGTRLSANALPRHTQTIKKRLRHHCKWAENCFRLLTTPEGQRRRTGRRPLRLRKTRAVEGVGVDYSLALNQCQGSLDSGMAPQVPPGREEGRVASRRAETGDEPPRPPQPRGAAGTGGWQKVGVGYPAGRRPRPSAGVLPPPPLGQPVHAVAPAR